jgi:hydroxymethylpyrimidine pyrophosphatase-like HAD family hydrolase
MPNDLPMLEWAGHGVAVANAHETVLAIANQRTVSNEEDGVATFIERHVCLE